MSLIEVRHLGKTHRNLAILSEIALDLERGEHIILTGPSGAGKSTLFRIIAGLDPASTGRVSIDGTVVSEGLARPVPAHRRGIGMVFQDLALWPNLTAAGNVALGLAGTHLSRVEKQQRVDEALEACAIKPLSFRRPEALSIGEQQRVALARTLAQNPAILLLDEPFGSLDVLSRENLFSLIRRICAEKEITALTVTHDPWDALGLDADRVLVLEQGQIVEEIGLDDLKRRPTTSRTLSAWQRLLSGRASDLSIV